MRHQRAQEIFNEIRARPYQLSTQPNTPANNCYFKGIELQQHLNQLGYKTRSHSGETFWDEKIIPREIIALYPPQFLITHFYIEAEIEGTWRNLDPSFDPPLAQTGFRIAEWSGQNAPCFNITKLYSETENAAYQKQWSDPAYASAYFTQAASFLNRMNQWLETVRR